MNCARILVAASTVLGIAIAITWATGATGADVFNMPAGQASLQFATVGDPGNVGEQSRLSLGDSTYYGAVPYAYRIGEYDVTTAQYCQFLNAVAKTDTYGLYSVNMGSGYFYQNVRLTQSGTPGSYSYAVTGNYSQAANCPIFCVTWGDAARFCNWLQHGQPTGDEGPGTTETGAYTLNGAISTAALLAISRNPGASYAIPAENEWYKAAFYKGGGTNAGYWSYATQSNTAPSNVLSASGTNNANYNVVSGGNPSGYTDATNLLTPVGAFAGSPGPYGTYDMAGDVWQWNEANIGSYARGLHGGDCNLGASYLTSSYRDYNGDPGDNWSTVGFRPVSLDVPEPGSLAMLLAVAVGLVIARWRHGK